jgi:outer membrane protein OmpA-like peptidoglycan-associated protein
MNRRAGIRKVVTWTALLLCAAAAPRGTWYSGASGEALAAEGRKSQSLPKREKIILRGVAFAATKWELTPDDRTVLDAAVRHLKKEPPDVVIVIGHTDSTESGEHGRDLSLKRAQAVRDYFIAAGIDAWRVAAAGAGDLHPVASNATEEGRAQNRRVTLQLFRA